MWEDCGGMSGGLPDLYNLLMRLQCEAMFLCDSMLAEALQQISSVKEDIPCSSLSLIVRFLKTNQSFCLSSHLSVNLMEVCVCFSDV